MNDLRTAAQQALEALEQLQNAIYNIGGEHVTGLGGANDAADSAEKPMGALRAALAEPVQEPFCYVYEYDSPYGLHREFYPREYNGMKPSRTVPLYTAPPQRPPLTEEEVEHLLSTHERNYDMVNFARAIERAHGIGGSE